MIQQFPPRSPSSTEEFLTRHARKPDARVRKRRLLVAAAFAALCVAPGAAHAAPRIDPLETFNRTGYAIHQFFDRVLIRPAALAYQKVVPGVVRDGLRHMLDNLGEPNIVANDLLQGRVKMARTATLRFATNSTFGVLGFFDMATPAGLPRHENGFDLTLGRAGIKSGPYLFIPLVGPTTFRDVIGEAVNTVFNPVRAVIPHDDHIFILAEGGVDGIDRRARADSELTAVLSDATDPYATLRSVYLQNQQSKIDDNKTTVPALPDFDEDATPATPSTPPASTPDLKPAAPGAGSAN